VSAEAVRNYWAQFWFQPSSPTALALCRILLFGGLFVLYWPLDSAAWSEVDRAFWMPIPLFEGVGLLPPPLLVGSVLAIIFKTSLALACVGFCTRASTAIAFLLALYLLGLPQNFGGLHHGDAAVVLVIGVMALSRCSDVWAVDALLSGGGDALDAEYTWPIRAVWLILAMVYFAAGIAKVRHAGLDWVASDNLALRLVHAHYGVAHADPATSWGLELAQHRWLCRALAGMALAAELGYPLALVSARLRYVLVPTIVLIQVGIRVTMGPSFAPLLLSHLFWVPWSSLADRIGVISSRYHGHRGDPAPREEGAVRRATSAPTSAPRPTGGIAPSRR
jgi:hypothetical protein